MPGAEYIRGFGSAKRQCLARGNCYINACSLNDKVQSGWLGRTGNNRPCRGPLWGGPVSLMWVRVGLLGAFQALGPGPGEVRRLTHLALQNENLLSPTPPGPWRGQKLLDVHIFPNLTGQHLERARPSVCPGERARPVCRQGRCVGLPGGRASARTAFLHPRGQLATFQEQLSLGRQRAPRAQHFLAVDA